MKDDKWDALRIAEWFDSGYGGCESEAADELRRQYEVIQELLAALQAAAIAIHEYRTQGAPHAYWDAIEAQAQAAIAKATGETK